MPRVSVIVPAFQYGRFLAAALDSVHAQTFQDWECLVVDDGSTDATPEIAAGFVAADPRFRLLQQANRGLAATRNRGVQETSGELVQFLDADDWIAPRKLETQIDLFAAAPERQVCCSGYQLFDERTGDLQPAFFDESLGDDPMHDFLFRWERGLCIPIHTALLRRSVWKGRPPFDESLASKEDWKMWLELALDGVRFFCHPEELAFYRLHGRNMHAAGAVQYLELLRVAQQVAPRLDDRLRGSFLERTLDYARESIVAGSNRAANSTITAGDRGETPGAHAPSALAGCTIVARNFASHARIVAASYLLAHPGDPFFVLFADGRPDDPKLPPGAIALDPAELAIPRFFEMCARYGVVELCTALKPHLLSYLLADCGQVAAVYLDPDVWVARRFDEVLSALAESDVVLTPHALTPPPLDGRRPDDSEWLTGGVFNLGFLAVRAGAAVTALLDWQKTRFFEQCRIATAEGLFVDQKWADLIPCYVERVAILRDPTYNVAYWNLHERRLQECGGNVLVDGRPLAFLHFSGIDFDSGEYLASHQNRTTIEPGSPLAMLIRDYLEAQRRSGWESCRHTPWRFASFANGIGWNAAFRHLYLGLDDTARQRFGDPFDDAALDSFFRWATTPAASGVAPFLLAIHRLRGDLERAFPEPEGSDRAAFLEWARTFGAREFGYPPSLVLAPEPEARS